MGLQNFVDEDGIAWRVWRVETPAARAHLMEAGYGHGWLVFEREDGTERRRLGEVPENWESLDLKRLALLCQVASPVARMLTGQQPVHSMNTQRNSARES